MGKGNILQETALSTTPSIQNRVDGWTDHCRGISKPNFTKSTIPLKNNQYTITMQKDIKGPFLNSTYSGHSSLSFLLSPFLKALGSPVLHPDTVSEWMSNTVN